MLAALGVILLGILLGHLIVAYRLAAPKGTWHPLVAVGLAILGWGHVALAYRLEPVYWNLTPWMWTGFILLVDGVNHRLVGRSIILTRPGTFYLLLPLSIAFWVIFEAYNLRLRNWDYVGLPEDVVHRYLGYAWAFSTILPALFLAAELYRNLCFSDSRKGWAWPGIERILPISMLAGALFLILPPFFREPYVGYLFGFVWLGVIFLLDPLNWRSGRRSLLKDVAEGNWQRIQALWWSGILCGFLWEFWNFWARAKWVYVFPILQDLKIFEMPLPGYVGFPFFAMECFVFCEWLLGKRRADFARI